MIIRTSTPSGTVIFCEDIRDEVRALKTFVGVYNTDIIIDGELPVIIPKMGFAIRYYESGSESEDSVRLTVTAPSQEGVTPQVVFEAEILPAGARPVLQPASADDLEVRLMVQVDFVISPMPLFQDGHIRVIAWRGDDEIRLGALKITARKAPAEHIVPD